MVRLIRRELANRNGHVSREAALFETVGRETVRDAGVEPNARDVEEESFLYLTCIDRAVTAAERQLERRRRVEGDTKFPRQTIARTARHQRKRRVGKRNCRPDFVHCPIAAPRNDCGNAARGGGKRKFACVPGTLGDEHVRRIGTPSRQQLCSLTGTCPGHVDTSPSARDGVDDDGYRGRRRSTLGGRNQTSSPGRRDVNPCMAT